MEDYIRHPKKKKKKKKKKETSQATDVPLEDKAPEVFAVGEMVEWVEEGGKIWDVEVLEVRNYGVVVSMSWDKKLFLLLVLSRKASSLVGYMEWKPVTTFVTHRKRRKRARISSVDSSVKALLKVAQEPLDDAQMGGIKFGSSHLSSL